MAQRSKAGKYKMPNKKIMKNSGMGKRTPMLKKSGRGK